ncbi:hypothetical protein [Bacterioplanoides sp.]|uniref:hypothetical protein n=1 Tax=Bacterioplanoides sp. TaxID=2066072 RepID=UPI003B5BCAF4
MTPTNNLKHLSIATLINGTLGVLIWLIYAWTKFGLFWSSETPQVWLVGLLIVGIFISVVCYPIFRFYGKELSAISLSLLGASLGAMSVLAFFVAATNYPVNFEYMIARAWLYYMIFSIIGGIYGYMYFVHKNS